MTTVYRDFSLDAHRERSLGGDTLLYYSAFDRRCGWELTSGFSDDDDALETHIKILKNRVDDYYENPDDYDHACRKEPTSAE